MKNFAATILSTISLVSALPTSNLEARTPGRVTFCTEANYKGECSTIQVPFNECYQLAAPFIHNVGSFKPDAGAFCRITYTQETCSLHGDAFIDPTPGAPNLHQFVDASDVTIDAGKTISSFLCQECTNCA